MAYHITIDQYRDLGSSGIKVSPLGLGTWQFGDVTGTYEKKSEDVEAAIIKTALDAGINLFDTAEGYNSGQAERSLAKAFGRSGRKREEYVIASKVADGNLSAEKVVEACNRSLENLNTPYIDLYQVHWPNHNIKIEETLKAMQKLKEDGKIRAIGVSNFGLQDLSEAVSVGIPISSNQLPYSLITRSIEYELHKCCVDHNVPIVVYCPLAQGLLTGKYTSVEQCSNGLTRSRLFHKSRSPTSRHQQEGCEDQLFKAISDIREISDSLNRPMPQVALKWLLSQPGIASVLIGASKPEQIVSNVQSLQVQLDEKTLKELNRVSEPVKAALGNNPDLWALSSRYR